MTWFDRIRVKKANPYHDKDGRFTSAENAVAPAGDNPSHRDEWTKEQYEERLSQLNEALLDEDYDEARKALKKIKILEDEMDAKFGDYPGKPKDYDDDYDKDYNDVPGETVNPETGEVTTAASTPQEQEIAAAYAAIGQEYVETNLREERGYRDYGEHLMDANMPHDMAEPARRATAWYQGSGYDDINGYLRGHYTREDIVDRGESFTEVATHLKSLDDALARSSARTNLTVYRGVNNPKSVFGVTSIDDLAGKIINDKGFMSTSTDRRVADGFGTSGMLFVINVPKGHNILHVERTSSYSMSEREMLLPRGTSLKVDRIEYINANRQPVAYASIVADHLKKAELLVSLASRRTVMTKQTKKINTDKFTWKAGDVTVIDPTKKTDPKPEKK